VDKYERRQWFERLLVMRAQYRLRSAASAFYPNTYEDFSTVKPTADEIAREAWNASLLSPITTDKEANR